MGHGVFARGLYCKQVKMWTTFKCTLFILLNTVILEIFALLIFARLIFAVVYYSRFQKGVK